MPGRKKRCRACRNEIFVRTRPHDRARILVRADQLVAVEELRAIENGTHDHFLAAQKRRQAVAEQLRRRFGRDPSENDVEWAILNDDCIAYARDAKWGLYRNTRFAMSELVAKENRPSEALNLLLEVCYLDLNGATNCCDPNDKELLRQFPPFDPKMAFVAPGVIRRVLKTMDELGLSPDQVEERVAEIGLRLVTSLLVPLPPVKVWSKLARELR